jgi:hypothetical protein
MTFTDRTDRGLRWRKHAMKLTLAIGEAVGLALGMATTTWNAPGGG